MTHPLHSLALLQTRERIRSAIGPCVGFCPEAHADRITERVLHVRIPQLELIEELNDRARRFADQDEEQRAQAGGRYR
jgi:hypothetical protein